MMRGKRFGAMWRVMVVLGLVLPWMMVPHEVQACSCAAPGDPETEFARATAVFDGTTIGVVRPGDFNYQMQQRLSQLPLLGIEEPRGIVKAQVRVNRSWKGVEHNTITLLAGLSNDINCSFDFSTGTRAIYYVMSGSGTEFVTSFCARTVPLFAAADDLAYLETRPMVDLPPVWLNVWGWLGFTLLILVAGIVVVGRMRKQAEQ